MMRGNDAVADEKGGGLSRSRDWIRGALSIALALTYGMVAWAGERPLGWAQVLSESVSLKVNSVPVAHPSGDLSGLVLEGAWSLESDHPDFGGLSALLVANGELYAASDHGRWFSASLVVENGTLYLENAALAPMRDMDGDTYDDVTGDAEGITWLGRRLAVSFERHDRIMILQDSGRLEDFVRSDLSEAFPSNVGIEALATLDDGRLMGLAEGADERGIPVLIVEPDGTVTEGRLSPSGPHSATGAHIGPDGRLYLLLRSTKRLFGYSFRGLLGSSIRIIRYHLGADGFPLADTAETLATFEGDSGIDRIEGIALEQDPQGKMHLWLISDDDFSYWKRTLLMRFAVVQ